MVIHDLSSDECRDVLSRAHLGRLACARFNQPYIVPLSFAFSPDDNCLYSLATHGQKIDWMRANPSVCVEVDDIGDERHWTTVAPESRATLFRPFQTTKARGTGLGLATAKRLVELHGGRIAVTCPSSGGTVVMVELPTEGVADAADG